MQVPAGWVCRDQKKHGVAHQNSAQRILGVGRMNEFYLVKRRPSEYFEDLREFEDFIESLEVD